MGPAKAAAAHPQARGACSTRFTAACCSTARLCNNLGWNEGHLLEPVHCLCMLKASPPSVPLQHRAWHALPALPQHPAPRPQACVSVSHRQALLPASMAVPGCPLLSQPDNRPASIPTRASVAFNSLGRCNRSPCRSNIFVGHGQLMKIGDFGMARIVGEANEGAPCLQASFAPWRIRVL